MARATTSFNTLGRTIETGEITNRTITGIDIALATILDENISTVSGTKLTAATVPTTALNFGIVSVEATVEGSGTAASGTEFEVGNDTISAGVFGASDTMICVLMFEVDVNVSASTTTVRLVEGANTVNITYTMTPSGGDEQFVFIPILTPKVGTPTTTFVSSLGYRNVATLTGFANDQTFDMRNAITVSIRHDTTIGGLTYNGRLKVLKLTGG